MHKLAILGLPNIYIVFHLYIIMNIDQKYIIYSLSIGCIYIYIYIVRLKKRKFLKLCQNMKIASKKQDINFFNAKLNFIFVK